MRAWMRRPSEASREDGGVEYEPRELAGMFAAPRWLRDLGLTAWLAVGVALALVGLVWLLSLTQTIVAPLITAAVIAAVASPLVRALEKRGIARGACAAVLLVAFLLLAVLVAVVVLNGVTSQKAEIRVELGSAKSTIAGWATDAGISHD